MIDNAWAWVKAVNCSEMLKLVQMELKEFGMILSALTLLASNSFILAHFKERRLDSLETESLQVILSGYKRSSFISTLLLIVPLLTFFVLGWFEWHPSGSTPMICEQA